MIAKDRHWCVYRCDVDNITHQALKGRGRGRGRDATFSMDMKLPAGAYAVGYLYHTPIGKVSVQSTGTNPEVEGIVVAECFSFTVRTLSPSHGYLSHLSPS